MRPLLVFAALICPLAAQEFRGTILGQVNDSSGSSIAGATVTATNTSTNVKIESRTTENGAYTIPFVIPGPYRVSVEAPGFKTAQRNNVTVAVQQRVRLDWQLDPGVVTESVTVTEEVPQLDASTASLGTVLPRQMITELPQNGRNPLMLARIAPGVMPTDTRIFTRPFDNGGASSISINGAPSASNEILMDGIPNADTSNTVAFIPSPEAVAEMKVQANTYDAEFGRAAGGTVNMTVRSGTNEFHGSLHEFWRNNVLDANEFFNNRSGLPRAPQRFHMFGATGGGPVYLPRVYNGRNRTFIFGAWESIRQADPGSTLTTVPTLLERNGDFSQSFDAGGRLLGIYDPFSTRPGTAAPGAFQRTPFPGNRIPASAIDPTSARLMTYYGAPNQPGAPFTAVENFAFSGSSPDNYDSLLLRGDHTLTAKQRLFVRGSISRRPRTDNNLFGTEATAPASANRVSRGLAMDYINTLSASILLNLRYGFTRYGDSNDSPEFSLTTIGQPAALASSVDTAHFPSINIAGYRSLGQSGDSLTRNNLHSFQANMTRVGSRFNLKWGMDYRIYQANTRNTGAAAGTYSFDPAFTRGPDPVANRTSGHAVASFLLGTPVSGRIDKNVAPAFSNSYYAGYLQGDIRVKPRFTLNTGLRYEYEAPRTERFDRMARGFGYDQPSPFRATGLDVRGGLLFAGADGNPRGQTDPQRTNFAPRIGFAWQLQPKVVFRAGYGIFFAGTTNFGGGVAAAPGFSVATAMVTSLDGVTPVNRLSNPFPTGLLQPSGASGGLRTLGGQSVAFTDPALQVPRTQQFSAGLQYQLTPKVLVEATYSGSRGSALASGDGNLNQLNPSLLARGNQLLQPVPNPFAGQFTTGILSRPTTTVGQLLRAYPQFDAVTMRSPTIGNSTFHSLQMRAERRMSGGLLLLGRYSWSKLLDDVGSPQNNYNRQAERALTGFDRTHRVVVSAVWELPFGPGRRWAGGSSPVLRKVMEGWQVDVMQTLHTGTPLGLNTVANTTGALGGSQRPNSTGRSAALSGSATERLSQWFDTSQFTLPAAFTFGNVGRTINVRGPGLQNLDVSLVKDTMIWEKLRVQLRGEAFNLTNTPAFANPGGTLGNPNFGRINAITQRANPARQIMLGMKILW